jgi:hypothetical protein
MIVFLEAAGAFPTVFSTLRVASDLRGGVRKIFFDLFSWCSFFLSVPGPEKGR